MELIYSYTRQEALADGTLIDVSKAAKEAGILFPTAVTDTVWRTIIEWPDDDTHKQIMQDTEGRLWDVVWMLKQAILKAKRTDDSIDTIHYSLYVVPRDGKAKKPKLTALKAQVHGGDQGEPVITIMLHEED